MNSRVSKTRSEFEIGDAVTVKGIGTGTVTKTFRNGDVQVKIDGGFENVYMAHAVKVITEDA